MSDTTNNGSAPEESTAKVENEAGAAEVTPKHHQMTRRQVLAMAGCGVAGLVVGGVLASWGVTTSARGCAR